MTIRVWGSRGSIPAPGPKTQRYGGNTSCVELRCGDSLCIFDAGTGIRELGNSWLTEFKGRAIQARLFISHLHWDHIQGFPFFVPAYLPTTQLTIHGPHGADRSFESMFKTLTDISHFPVDFGDMSKLIRFVEIDGAVLRQEDLEIRTTFTNHPGMNVGYRISFGGKSLVYLTDHETYQAMNKPSDYGLRQDEAIMKFCSGADMLITDAQYTDEEYAMKRTWGHSRFSDAVALGLAAGVKKLVLFHHDPGHDDEQLDAIAQSAAKIIKTDGRPMESAMARDGLEISL